MTLQTDARQVPDEHPRSASIIAPGMEALRSISISHRSAPLEMLERVALTAAQVAALLREFARRGFEAAVVSTCNRTELYWSSRGPRADAEIEGLLYDVRGTEPPPRDHVVELRGPEAARHLFRVAAGLESLVLGEAEILGQLRAAIDQADLRNTSGFFVSGLFRAALRFGGYVRQETAIGAGALSVASASISLLTRVHPDLSRRTVVVVGAGDTGLKAARHLRAEGVGRLVVVNRTLARAEEIAAELDGEAGSLESLPQWLPLADGVVAAAHVDRPIVTAAMLRDAALPAGRVRVLLDLSLPRAIEPACARAEGVVLHDLSGLEQIVAHNRSRREREIPRVESLLARELAQFQAQMRESAVRPVLTELWRMAEAIRRGEIERARADGVADDEMLERVTRRIIDRLLHGPSMALRRGDLALDGQHAHYFRLMFGLPAGTPPPGPQGPHEHDHAPRGQREAD
ncbi:MAG TPA: glutamyl-tRNA reductase [Candidatus Eisenbacteria bacterium]